jgi:hypothetical protein
MTCVGYGKKFSYLNLKYYSRLEGPTKTTENLIQDSRYPDSDLNPGLPSYEVLPQRSAEVFLLEIE